MKNSEELAAMLPSDIVFPSSWQDFIHEQTQQAYFATLMNNLQRERATGVAIYPKQEAVFNAFKYKQIADIKIVILGQDPYHGMNQANGLAFSVPAMEKIPPSLRNIYKEIANCIDGFRVPQHGDLTLWAEQGVLLLNTVLTVQQGKAHSHAKFGWERFTDKVIEEINSLDSPCVFMLWGAHAQAKGVNIDRQRHLVLESVHPSPLSAYRGFFGCQHFSLANEWLQSQHILPIDWSLDEHETLDLFSS